MGIVISVVNQKGGVGKTTTAVNLSSALALDGRRVLLIDMDPQANSTSSILGKVTEDQLTVYEVLYDRNMIDDTIRPTEINNLYIIPSGIDLAGAEIELVSAISRENRLKKALQKIKEKFDFLLIDCPPSLGLLTLNSLTASDLIIVPVQCEYFALEGLGKLIETYDLVKDNLNPELEILGVLLTMYDKRTRLSEEVAEEIRKYFGDRVFKTVIPRSVRLSEAPGFSKPIQIYAPASSGAKAYNELAKEVVDYVSKKLG